ncbi:MAG: c-type cytochrome [Actinobacteria bacterium]|uniref:Unannotated protein n=1 Tax=freshwater metagenome TaxID=449393 RepID=A0A6J6A0I8_9ZZZZ|nr:c-type cytochrome [Actinomycetota bacterium]
MVVVAVFIAVFVIAGLAVAGAAFASTRSAQAEGASSSGGGKMFYVGIAICVVGIGLGIPGLLIVGNADKSSRDAVGGVVLTASQEKGRVLFAQNCASCHTLQASGSAGQTGPNLDVMHPPEALILNAIKVGRARGAGNMPAGLVTGVQADEVASYVSAVAGQGNVSLENASVQQP